ncbi:Hypothetical predicted protein [Octopus vulgaris]|uniref:Uncharacterized protein n=1 Tax=Octopus vulgaris TaxID=6645 RepID=A0AA36BWD4_OCTVU|nr:Hypothetical predicted protein [Octopus vulgaris]
MATRARSGRHWAHCPRLRDNELALGAIGLTVHGYETTVSAMAARARSGRHWAHCPRLRDNGERYGGTRARSGRHWAHCPRLRDNGERYGDQSSL